MELMRLCLKRLFPKTNISFVKKLSVNIPQRFRFKILFSLGLLSFLLLALTVTLDLSQRSQNIKGKAEEIKDEKTEKSGAKYKGYIVEFKNEPKVPYLKQLMGGEIKETKEVSLNTYQVNLETYDKTLKSEHELAKKDILHLLGKETTAEETINSQQEATITSPVIMREYTTVLNGIALDINDEEAEIIKKSPYVKNVSPDYLVKPALLTSVPLIKANQVWNLKDNQGRNITGKGVLIAIIDTGVGYPHPDLGGCTLGQINKNQCPKIAPGGYDFVNNDSDPLDDTNGSHGTHVASIIAGNGKLKGVAPEARIIAYKVMNQNGGQESYVIAAMEKAIQTRLDLDSPNNIHIINLSMATACIGEYSSDCGPNDPSSRAVDRAVDMGITVVTAAGNEGARGSGSITSPGTARKAITVGTFRFFGSELIDKDSSRGPVIWQGETIQKPDIVAPGYEICAANYGNITSIPCLPNTNAYTRTGKTSAAAAHVAGTAALLLQANPNSTPEQIKTLIKQGAQDLYVDKNAQGAGLLDALASVSLISSSCREDDWKYECKGRGSCNTDAGVGIPYRCENGEWANKNPYGECTKKCSTSEPIPPTTCRNGDWKYECAGKTDVCFNQNKSDSGVGIPYRCENGEWVNKNPAGECTPKCNQPCNNGEWKYYCSGEMGPCTGKSAVGIPYRCEQGKWINKNSYGECTRKCY